MTPLTLKAFVLLGLPFFSALVASAATVPTSLPTFKPTFKPTNKPTRKPTKPPTTVEDDIPTKIPTNPPTPAPTKAPTMSPMATPTNIPTSPSPTEAPTTSPTVLPTSLPTLSPTSLPTSSPTPFPTFAITSLPTAPLTSSPTFPLTSSPTAPLTSSPTSPLTSSPTSPFTSSPAAPFTSSPTAPVTASPTSSPTVPRPTLPPIKISTGPTVYQGTDFWFVETPNLVCNGMTVAVANPSQVQANVVIDHAASLTTTPLTVAAGDLQTATFPCTSSISDFLTTTNSVYHLTSDVGVVVYIFIPLLDVYSNDATLVLPTPTLGTRYRVASYINTSNGYGSYFNIVAVENGTTIQVFDTTNAIVGAPITISQGQLFQRIIGATDFTGWSIVTDKPVAVFTGTGCTAVGTSTGACDTLMEQILPESALSSQYVVCPTLSRPIGCSAASCSPDLFRYVATADNTIVTLAGSATSIQTVLNRGQFYELQTNDPHTVTADHPLYVFQYLISELSGNPVPLTGDPSLINVTPISLYQSGYSFLTPTSFQFDFINIAAPVGTTFSLDGAALVPFTCTSVGFVGTTEYCCGLVPVPDGVHHIVADKPFGLTVTGFDQFASYGYV